MSATFKNAFRSQIRWMKFSGHPLLATPARWRPENARFVGFCVARKRPTHRRVPVSETKLRRNAPAARMCAFGVFKQSIHSHRLFRILSGETNRMCMCVLYYKSFRYKLINVTAKNERVLPRRFVSGGGNVATNFYRCNSAHPFLLVRFTDWLAARGWEAF